MLNKIIRFSLQNRLAILAAALIILLAGVYTAKTMEVDVFPDLNAPTVVVMTEAQGMAPEEVERVVTFPIETAVNGATGVRRVRSSSQTGFSCVWVEFDWGTDIYRDRQIVNEKLAEVSADLPANVGKPTLGPQSSILGEVMIIGLTCQAPNASNQAPNASNQAPSASNQAPNASNQAPSASNQAPSATVPDGFPSGPISSETLRTLADWTLRPRLLSIGGVAQVSVQGGDTKEYQVKLHPERMKHHDVSIDEAVEAVRDMNQNVSGGVLYEHGNEYLIRGELQAHDIDDLGQTVVKIVEGVPVLLGQVADIEIGNHSPKTGVASNNARPAVLLTIAKQPNVSTEELTQKIDEALDDMKAQLPEGVHVDSQIFRQKRFIDASISNIQESLWEGAVFVVIVLLLFLMNVRITLISLVSIPLSLLVSILTLKYLGLSINTMSIGGMAIAIGSLVDDAIVDVENVHRRLSDAAGGMGSTGDMGGTGISGLSGRLSIIYEASREVRMPILNSTLIVLVCFMPLFFLNGIEGRMLIPLGIAFMVSLFASTIVALTLTPVLCSYLLKPTATHQGGAQATTTALPGTPHGEARWVTKMKEGYRSLLTRAFAYNKVMLGAAVALLVVAVGLYFTVGRSFLPNFNEGSYTISLSTLPGISLEESDKLGQQAERLLMEIPEIQTVARKTGRAELDEHAFGVNTSEIEAPFVLKDRSRHELLAEVRQKLSTLPGMAIEIGQPISHRIDAMLSGTRANIAIKLFGTDLGRMHRLANEIKEAIEDVPGVADLNVEQLVERPQLRITPRRHLMAKYGVTPRQFADYIRVMLEGEVVSQVYEDGARFDLVVKCDEEDRDGIDRIREMMIDAGGASVNGEKIKIPLEYIATIESTTGPNTINRENAQRKIVISANAEGRDLRSTVNEVQQRIAERITLPEGYHLEYGGQFESEEKASRTLFGLTIVAIVIIFLLLLGQFRNARLSAIVLINLPLALIGGMFAIVLTDGVMSIPSIIGFISLFGIATRNGILLIDRYGELRRQHPDAPIDSLILQGSSERLTPILMTALTSALALVPLALGGDLAGNEIQSPMAKVMLGGLISSTLLNMFIVPIIFRASAKSEK